LIKHNRFLIAIIGGLAAALLHASVVTLTPLSALLFYLAPLPLFIVGLSFGWLPAAMSAAIGGGVLSGLWGVKTGAFFLIASAAGPVILTRLALINRPATAGGNEGEASDGRLLWYPEGRLLLWAAGLAGALLTLVILIMGPDAESFRAQLKTISEKFATALLTELPAQQQQGLAQFIDFLVMLAPMASAAAWLVAMTVNLLLASRLLKAWGMAIRPWAPFSSLKFPRLSAVALAGACALSLMPGTAGLIGSVYAAPLCTAFAILGLAVLHFLLLGHSARVPILAGLYGVLILLSWIVMVPLIALGLAELGWNLRARLRPLPPNNRNIQ
jgi:Predicted membrane protein (DUF2232)